MKLLLFTAHFPFRGGEAFLADDMETAETLFDEILILTGEKDLRKARYELPAKVRVIAYRGDIRPLSRILRMIPALFSARLWRELRYAARTTKRPIPEILRRILIDESEIRCIIASEEKWKPLISPEDTVCCSYWLSSAAIYLSRRLDGRFLRVSRTHGGDCFFDRAYHSYRREQLRGLDAVFPISEAGRRDLLEHYGDDCPDLADKLRVSRLGILLHGSEQNPWEPNGVKTLVSCSNVIPLKRLDLLIDALSRLGELPLRWVHFGDGSEMEAVQRLAEEKLSGRPGLSYTFMGSVHKDEILRFYGRESVDLFVNCSDAEGVPVSMMEAMAYGIPAIGRDVGGIRELLDSSCGILLGKEADPALLAEAIKTILTMDSDALLALRAASGTRVRTSYSSEKNYSEFYNSLAGMLDAVNDAKENS